MDTQGDEKLAQTQASYNAVAEEYARQLFDELQNTPLDRELLERPVKNVNALGVICDLGCGPSQIARYLHERGAQVCGIDLSPNMVALANRLNPQIPFAQGNMFALSQVDDDTLSNPRMSARC